MLFFICYFRQVSELEETINALQGEKRAIDSQLRDKQNESDDLRVQNEKLYEKLQIRDQEVTM